MPGVSDFISPAGPLTPALYPGENLETLVAAWLADATALTDNANAQTSWVLYRAYDHVADRLSAGLSSETKGPVSASRSDQQFAHWRRKSARALAAYQAITRAARGVTSVEAVW